MKNTFNILCAFLFAVVALCIINSCKKDDNNTNDGGAVSGTSAKTTVTGMVLDESNAPLSGVTVTAYGQTTITSQYGTFVLKDLSANMNRCILKFTKAGFFNRAHAFKAAANTVNYVRIVLNSNAVTQTFASSSGGTVSNNNASVAFAPNSFVTAAGGAYTGTVNVTVKHLSPADATFGFSIPGGDLAGVNTNDESVVLYSYGMLGVVLTGSGGELLQLATGTTATLTMAVAAAQLATAPSTIPLWYLDEATSLWKEEGQATLVGGNYVGTVTHFSWWNYDYQGPRATIKGKVVDCQGTPMPNVNVTVNGWYIMTTNQFGDYSSDVPVGMTFTVQVLASNNSGILSSQIENVPVLTNGQVYIVPTLVIPCPSRIAGTLKTCAGEVTAGGVYISNTSGFSNYQYTSTGAFNLAVPENSQIHVYAHSPLGSLQQTVTSLAAPNVLNVANVLLCDTINTSVTNCFTINGGGFSNQFFSIIPTSEAASDSGSFAIQVYGYTLSGYDISFGIWLSDTIIGIHQWVATWPSPSFINIAIDSIGKHYVVSTEGYSGSINLTEVGYVGGRVKGYYSGQAGIDTTNGGVGSFVPITIYGNFDVLRTQ